MVVTLVGAGNLATNLGAALQKNGHEIRQVWSRTEASAKTLAQRLSCDWTTDISTLATEADVVVLSVKDNALEELSRRLASASRTKQSKALFVHTAGSMPLTALSQQRSGVFYPMQTFSKTRLADFSNIPIFLETQYAEDLPLLRSLAESLSHSVYELPSEKRRFLHLAAVFACNFANRCYDIASEILEPEGIPFSVMLPLIDETAQKVHTLTPKDAQTGPAIRWDENVMEKHLLLLDDKEKELYRLLSQSIHERQKQ